MTGVMPISGTMPVTTAYDTRDLNRDGHISSAERLADVAPISTPYDSAYDSRDLNRDGHVSTTEKLAAGSHRSGAYDSNYDSNRSGAYDSRDLNRDGHVSTTEKLASDIGQGENSRMRLHEEQLAVSKREVGAGQVDIHKRVQEDHVQQTVPVMREEVTVERRPLTGPAEPGARIAAQDEIVRVPLYREELVTEKRIVPTEEVIVRKKEVMDQQTVGATLRSEFVDTQQSSRGTYDARDVNRDGHVSLGEKLQGSSAGVYDARDTNRDGHVSMGEKLQGSSAGAYDVRDTNRDGHVSMGEKIQGAAAPASSFKAARG